MTATQSPRATARDVERRTEPRHDGLTPLARIKIGIVYLSKAPIDSACYDHLRTSTGDGATLSYAMRIAVANAALPGVSVTTAPPPDTGA